MEKKLLLQEVADLLATKTGISRKAADSFSRLFFDLIVEGLTKDKYVKIKGLGTFKIVSVGERESINIHTGERIQISGHNKITFTQDPFIKDLVNKPFAHFQTVPLNDETEISELEEVYQMPIIQSEATDDEDEPQEEMTEENELTHEAAMTEDEPTTESEEEAQDTADTTPADDNAAHTSVELEAENKPDIPEETQSAEEISEEKQIQEDHAEVIAQEAENIEQSTADKQPNTAEELESEEVEVEEVGPAKTYTVQPIGGTEQGSHGPVDFVVEIRSDKRLAKWKMIALGLFVVILMGAAYCIGYYRVLTPGADQATQPAATEAKTAKPAATAKTANQEQKKADPPKQKADNPQRQLPSPSPHRLNKNRRSHNRPRLVITSSRAVKTSMALPGKCMAANHTRHSSSKPTTSKIPTSWTWAQNSSCLRWTAKIHKRCLTATTSSRR